MANPITDTAREIRQIAARLPAGDKTGTPKVYAVENDRVDVPPTIDLYPYGEPSEDAVWVAPFTRFEERGL